MKIKLKDYNNLDYSVWVSGSTGTIGKWIQYSVNNCINTRVVGTDPFGKTDAILWKAASSGTTSGATNGGWFNNSGTGNPIAVDNTKSYRVSCWIMKTTFTSGGKTDNSEIPFGIRTYSNDTFTASNLTDISSGAVGAGGYVTWGTFTNSAMTQNEWRLHSAYIRPYTWTGTTDSAQTGIFKPSGFNCGIGAGSGDMKFSATTTHMTSICLSPFAYSNTTMTGLTNYMVYPRIDLVDGTEPSFNTILTGEGPFREVSNVMIKNDNNNINYLTWNPTGTTGSIGMFTENATGTINSRVNFTDPFGSNVPMWKGITTTDANNMAGGWKTSNIAIDVTKTYRSSVWLKRTDSFINQNMYSSMVAFSGASQINTIDISTGGISASNYSIIVSQTSVSGMTTDEWRLHVTYIRPFSWTGTTDVGGIYKPNGTNLGSFTGKGDLKFSATTTHVQNWELFPYSTGTGGSGKTCYACYPRLDLVDGTEPSIATLLAGEGPWRNVVGGSVNISGTWKTITGTTW